MSTETQLALTKTEETPDNAGFALFGREHDGRPKTFWRSSLLQWLVSISVFLIVWQLITMSGLVDTRALSPPRDILKEISHHPDFFKLEYIPRRGNFFNLPTTIYVSMLRTVLGLTSAFVASLVFGVLISYVRLLRRLIMPIIRLFAPISPIAWMPLIVVVLGVGENAIVFIIFISLFFILTLSTLLSADNVDKVYIDAAKVLGATRWQSLWNITVPAIIPDLFLTLRLNFYAAWMSLLIAEFIGAKTGLGQMVLAGRSVFNMDLVILGMILIGFLGALTEGLLRIIQDKALWWRTETEL